MDIKKLGILSSVSRIGRFLMVAMVGILPACEKDEPREREEEDVERVTVVYAVNISSLSSDFISDRSEMVEGLVKANNPKARLLLYCSPSESESVLYEAQKEGDTYIWKELRSYDRKVTSTDPGRISRVLGDAVEIYPDVARTLIFWGHGSSWTPSFTDHTPRASIVEGAPTKPSDAYGGEYGQGGTKWTELDQLAAAVPNSAFDTIWFDCCYMSSTEVAYQFRDKCQWLVAYPTEVWQYGLNYDGIIPYLQRATPNLVGAAECFYNFYEQSNLPVTVSVMDMSAIEGMADAVKDIVDAYPKSGSVSDVVNYGRNGARYYDLYQEMRSRSNYNEAMLAALQQALDKFIVYHAESATNFNRQPWIAQPLSGISMDHYTGGDSDCAVFYRTLAWYNRIYR